MNVDKLTYYYPSSPEDTTAQGLDPSMEGGTQGAGPFKDLDLRKHTLEAFHRGESPFVAVAMKDVPYGTKFPLKLDSGQEVPAMVVDTGGGLRSGTQVDVATENPNLAKGGGSSRASKIPIVSSIVDSPMATTPDAPMIPLDVPNSGQIPDINAPVDQSPQDITTQESQDLQTQIDQYPKIAGEPTAESIDAATPDEVQSPAEQAATDQVPADQPETGHYPIPDPNGLVKVDRVDGSNVHFKNGMILDMNTKAITYPDPAGNLWTMGPNMPKPVKIKSADKSSVHPAIMNQLISYGAPLAKPDGSAFKDDQEAGAALQKFQKDNNIPTKTQQHIADLITNKLASSRNPYTKNYLAMQGNYESAMDNINKTERNGVDDSFLLSAIAGIENPGRSNTENDFRVAMKAAGIRGNIDVMVKRAKALFDGSTDDQGRIIPDAMLPQIKTAAINAVKSRFNQYQAGVEPFRRQLQNAGLDPDNYIPPIKLAGTEEQQKPSGPPTITNQADYDALISGTKYMGPDGKVHTKR